MRGPRDQVWVMGPGVSCRIWNVGLNFVIDWCKAIVFTPKFNLFSWKFHPRYVTCYKVWIHEYIEKMLEKNLQHFQVVSSFWCNNSNVYRMIWDHFIVRDLVDLLTHQYTLINMFIKSKRINMLVRIPTICQSIVHSAESGLE